MPIMSFATAASTVAMSPAGDRAHISFGHEDATFVATEIDESAQALRHDDDGNVVRLCLGEGGLERPRDVAGAVTFEHQPAHAGANGRANELGVEPGENANGKHPRVEAPVERGRLPRGKTCGATSTSSPSSTSGGDVRRIERVEPPRVPLRRAHAAQSARVHDDRDLGRLGNVATSTASTRF